MKRLIRFVWSLIKALLLLAPGIATALWLCKAHGWPVSLMAALGVELVFSIVITLILSIAARVKVELDNLRSANGAIDNSK